jgi:hypothetical protein
MLDVHPGEALPGDGLDLKACQAGGGHIVPLEALDLL